MEEGTKNIICVYSAQVIAISPIAIIVVVVVVIDRGVCHWRTLHFLIFC